MPTVLPSSIFDFVLGTSPSWSPKVYALHSRTPYSAESTVYSNRYGYPSAPPGARRPAARRGARATLRVCRYNRSTRVVHDVSIVV